MSDEETNEPFVVKSVDDIKSAMQRMVMLVRELNRIDKQGVAYLKKHKERKAPIIAELAMLREAIAAYIFPRKKSWLQYRGRTVEFDGLGSITFRVISTSLDLPKDEKPLIAALERSPALRRRYLVKTYKLNKRALAQASPWTRRVLAAYGAWAGRHENLSIKVEGEDEPTTVRHYRYMGPRKTK